MFYFLDCWGLLGKPETILSTNQLDINKQTLSHLMRRKIKKNLWDQSIYMNIG